MDALEADARTRRSSSSNASTELSMASSASGSAAHELDVTMSDAAPGSNQTSGMAFDSPGSTGAPEFSQTLPPISPSRTATQLGLSGQVGPQKRRALGKTASHRAAGMGLYGGAGPSAHSFGYGDDYGADYDESMVGRRIGDEKPLLDERIRERYLRELGDIFAPGR